MTMVTVIFLFIFIKFRLLTSYKSGDLSFYSYGFIPYFSIQIFILEFLSSIVGQNMALSIIAWYLHV
jgi:hypothetical protein